MRSDRLLDTAPTGGEFEAAIAAADPTVTQHPAFVSQSTDVPLAVLDVNPLTAAELESLTSALNAIEEEALEQELRSLCDEIAASYLEQIADTVSREWEAEIRPSILDPDHTLNQLLDRSLNRAKAALEARRAQWDN